MRLFLLLGIPFVLVLAALYFLYTALDSGHLLGS